MKGIILCFLLFLNTLLLYSQTDCLIKGKLVDKSGSPVELATVVLRNTADSTKALIEYSESDGKFQFSSVGYATYIPEVNYIGFEKYKGGIVVIDSRNCMVTLPDIALNTSETMLKEVAVTAKTPYIQRKVDRTVVNVDALIANAGSSTMEALERSPGVSVDANGAIKLKGRSGVMIFIDDKPTYLTGDELTNLLRSMPADGIKQIEIMTNPPAKYEAAGNAGVINIVTKRNKNPGFNGNVTVNATQGQYTRSNNSLNLNLNRQKFSIYSSFNAGVRNSFQDLTINRYYKNADLSPSRSFSQNSYIVPHSRSLSGKIGLDYYVSDRTIIGCSVKGLTTPGSTQTDNFAAVLTPQKDTLQRVIADNFDEDSFNNGTFNINLRHNIDTLGSNIVFDADYVRYSSNSAQTFKNYIYGGDGMLQYSDRVNGLLPSDIIIYAAKADYTKPLKSGAKFEAGWKSAFTQTDNEAAYTNTIADTTTIDYNLSNRFLYDEWIHAAYINYSQTFGRVDLQGGLRAESTVLKGNQLGNAQVQGSKFTRSYINVFPTFYASWHLDSLDKNVLSLSYGRRIDRPLFEDLNPFVKPLDKFTFYAGNPNLLSTYSHNISLTHSFKGIVNTSINYGATIDGINETLEIKDGIYYSRPGNIDNSQSLTLSVDATIPLAKWYNLIVYTEGGRLAYKSKLYTEQLNSSGNYMYASLNNSLQFGKGWSGELRGEYQSDIVVSQLLIKSFGTLNFAVAKKFLKGAGSVKLAFNDILYTRRSDGVINNLALTDADWNSDLDTRTAVITFSYRFGKTMNEKPKHNANGSEDEQRRVKG